MVKKIQIGARIILGLIYFVFGSMGLAMALGFMSMPDQPMSEAAAGFMKGMMGTGYFFPFLKLTEAVFGFLLLIGFAVPIALIVLAPVTLHIILFHVFLSPGIDHLILPVLMVIMQAVAMGAYGDLYKPLFQNRKKG